MHPLCRTLSVCLSLLLLLQTTRTWGGDRPGTAAPALKQRKAANRPLQNVRGTVSVPYIVWHPGTAREVVWFMDRRGPLATGEELTQQETRALLAALAAGVPLAPLGSLTEKLRQGQPLEAWERQLWADYLAYLGMKGDATQVAREDMRPTADDRRDMALRVALAALLPGMADEMGEAFHLQNLFFVVTSAATMYLAMWAIPLPITQLAAVSITLTLLVAFGAQLLAHVISEWSDLVRATARARTFAEVKAAGVGFGRAIGADGARVLLVLASLALGNSLSGTLKHLPRPPGGPAWMAEVPGGLRVPVSGVQSITVQGDSFIVTMAAGGGGGFIANERQTEARDTREIKWSSKSVRDAAEALKQGRTEVTVANRSEAEELFLRYFQGDGYRNTTGLSPKEVKGFYRKKEGTYHWDEGDKAFPHEMNHLQVHDFEGQIIRIYFP